MESLWELTLEKPLLIIWKRGWSRCRENQTWYPCGWRIVSKASGVLHENRGFGPLGCDLWLLWMLIWCLKVIPIRRLSTCVEHFPRNESPRLWCVSCSQFPPEGEGVKCACGSREADPAEPQTRSPSGWTKKKGKATLPPPRLHPEGGGWSVEFKQNPAASQSAAPRVGSGQNKRQL